jgi:hypothetical protein
VPAVGRHEHHDRFFDQHRISLLQEVKEGIGVGRRGHESFKITETLPSLKSGAIPIVEAGN